MSVMTSSPELLLPWESTVEGDRRFLRVLRNTLLVLTLFAIVVPLLPVPELTREQREEMPAPLARIILEKKTLPEPLKPLPRPAEDKPEFREPEEKVKQQPRDKPKPVDQLEQARKVAAVSGLLAFQDDLSDMRDSIDVNTLNQAQMRRGQASAASTERSIVTSGIPADSGGIRTSALSRDTGGAALSGRETTQVQSTIASKTAKTGKSQSETPGGRSDESIRRVMDGNKGPIFAIYNRALRRDPLLQGKLVFEMVIDPAGGVMQITLVSSELSDPLTSKILSRIRLINFGAEDVNSTHVNYSLDFLTHS
jgi:protein TonB